MGFWGTLGKLAIPAASIAAIPFTGGASAAGLLGTLGKVAGAAGSIGSVLGGAAKGSADQRGSDAQLALQRAQLEALIAQGQANSNQTQARDTFNAGLDSSKFGATEQQRGMKNALVSQLLGGVQDVNIGGLSSRVPKVNVTGGLRPSNLDAGSAPPGPISGPVGGGQTTGGQLGHITRGGTQPIQIEGVGGPDVSTGMPVGGGTNLAPVGGPSSTRAALMAALTQPTMQAPTFTPGAGYEAPTLPGMPTAGKGEKILGGLGLGTSILGALGGLFNKQKPMDGRQAPIGNPNLLGNVSFGGR